MKIFDVQIDEITRAQARQKLSEKQVIFTPNPEILLEAQKNAPFKAALQKGSLMLPDGHGLLFVSRLMAIPSRFLRVLLYFPLALLFLIWKAPFKAIFPEVIHGSDFMDDVVQKAADSGWTVYFLGGKEGAAEKTADFFLKKYPKLLLSGFSALDPHEALASIQKAAPQVLFIAYGAPKQELWIAQHFEKIPSLRLVMGVGGSFDFYSHFIKRAPRGLRLLGLEWFWRLLLNPRQRIRRIVNAVFVFPWKCLWWL